MPIYEYKCPECAAVTEFILKFNDPAPTECPACGQTVKMVKLMSATNFHLKGGGWYKDKYDSASNRPPEDKSSSSAASSADSSAGKSDAPAKSGDSKPAPAKADSPAKSSSPASSSSSDSKK